MSVGTSLIMFQSLSIWTNHTDLFCFIQRDFLKYALGTLKKNKSFSVLLNEYIIIIYIY